MMVQTRVELRSNVAEMYQRAIEVFQPEVVNGDIAAACTVCTRSNFRQLQSLRGGKGGSGFYHAYMDNTIAWSDSTRAVVRTYDAFSSSPNKSPLLAHFYGAVIKPVVAKWLTIPANPEAYGKRAGEFDNLQFVPVNAGLALLVKKAPPRAKVKGKKKESVAGVVMYWLKKRVELRADETVLPSETSMLEAAREALWRRMVYLSKKGRKP